MDNIESDNKSQGLLETHKSVDQIARRRTVEEAEAAKVGNMGAALSLYFTTAGGVLGSVFGGPLGAVAGSAIGASYGAAIMSDNSRHLHKLSPAKRSSDMIKLIAPAVKDGKTDQFIEGLDSSDSKLAKADIEFYKAAVNLAKEIPDEWPKVEESLIKSVNQQGSGLAALALKAHFVQNNI